ncbi:LCP family protein [Chengkuizengella marina]|uniref:LytR family transcriptional regulator n=1 Tax=Chengkuizengella marina TaxID=2507566 RepID=A0A6N9Q455_9BACL|nr:LCP family protein [Chengkuizengella marina]NBI29550.1 LytR family transcriptional regulator [Chengkuizengella marina]
MKKKYIYILSAVLLVFISSYFLKNTIKFMAFNWFFAQHLEEKLEQSYEPLTESKNILKSNENVTYQLNNPGIINFQLFPRTVQLKKEKKEENETTIENTKPFAMLLLGEDARGKEQGRSDSIILSIIRPSDLKVLLLSIPRDTYVKIPGRRGKDKINHAFAFGGVKLAKDTVEHFFDISIHNYAKINFYGFKQLVNALGGISLAVEKDLIKYTYSGAEIIVVGGKESYNGEEALQFARFRSDSQGDFGRMERHQEVLIAIIEEAKKPSNITKLFDVIEIIGENLKTDMKPYMIKELANLYLKSENPQIQTYTLKGIPSNNNPQKIWYDYVNETEYTKVKTMIDEWLNSDTSEDELIKYFKEEKVSPVSQ